MEKIKIFLSAFFLYLSQNSIAQNLDISGTYFNIFNDDIGFDNCCRLIEVFRLNDNKTFNYYRKNDQGDYKIENISYGKYQVVGDSVLFISSPDTTKNNYSNHFFEYSGFKVKIVKHGLQTLKPVNNVAGGKSEKINYHKMNFNNFDSLHIYVNKSDSTWDTENLIIKKDKTLSFSLSSMNYKTKQTTSEHKNIILTNEKYNLFLRIFSESPLFELTTKINKQNSYVLNLYMNGEKFSNGSDYLSEHLYNFLFKELLER